MANLSYGSSGSDVKNLQTLLNKNGYNLDVDGSFGAKTQAAVRDYQSKNGLDVDGIAGVQTMGKLTSTNTSSPAQQTTAAQPSSLFKAYDPSKDQSYQSAIATLQAAQTEKPSYAGTYDGQLKELYDSIVNRDKFTYDVNADALYKQYADMYTQKGKMAMMDTMGQAAALTGGYGNSYGQAVGQQAYNAYLQELGAMVPELYDRAYGQYKDEGQQMLQNYQMLGDLADDEYGKYQDAYGRWTSERDYAQGLADQAYDRGYDQWAAQLQQANADREYQLQLDQIAYQKERDKIADQRYEAEKAAAASAASAAASRSSKSSSTSNYDPETAAMQKKLNSMGAKLDVDGVWGPATQAAYDKYMGGGNKTGTYSIGELMDAAAAGYSKAQIESLLKDRGVDTSKATVQADIKRALSK